MRVYVVIAVILVVGGLIGWYALDHVNDSKVLSAEEKKQALTQILGREPILTATQEDTSWVHYKGNLISLSYPKAAVVYPQVTKKPGYEQFSFGLQQEHILAVIQVQNDIHVSSLADVPAVQVRSSDSYEEQPISVHGIVGKGFLKVSDGVERTAFFLQNGTLYSIAVSGSDQKTVEDVFSRFLQSIVFARV